MTAADYASRFVVGDIVRMYTDPHGSAYDLCRVVSVGANRLTVVRESNGKRVSRAYTTKVAIRDRFNSRKVDREVFAKMTARDLWLEERPQPVVGIGAYSNSVEIQPIAIRDRLDEVIAYLTAYSEWRRKEPPP